MFARIGRTTTELNLREGPGLNYTILTKLPEGTRLTVKAVEEPWIQVAALNWEGYVHQDYVEFPLTAKTTVAVGVRESPGEQAALVNALFEDTLLLTFQEEDGWLPVIALGQPGYIPTDTLIYPRVAKTTGHVNLRIGSGTEHRILEMLPPETQIHVWREEGEWFYVADTTMSGYLHRDFVGFEDQEKPKDAVVTEHESAVPVDVTLEPADSEKLYPASGAGKTEQQVAGIWNRLGGLLKPLADSLKIDPAVTVAVLAVESGGRGFGSDGRMIIRFENHIFYQRWGKEHEDVYRQHFTFSADKSWTEHQWRPSADQPWKTFHGNQAAEWEILEFACTLDDTAAKLSISMGGPQIMGFNYASLGYGSVQQMFDAFAASERAQVMGLFDFIQGRTTPSRRVTALQALDFTEFAKLYNGPGQAETYGNLIRGCYEAFHKLKP